MTSRPTLRLRAFLEHLVPERRLFIRSGDHTRFIRLTPGIQVAGWSASALLVGWSIVAAAILLMDSIGAGNFRAQAQRDQMVYEDRLDALATERDAAQAEASAANERFAAALRQVSSMQDDLLAAEARADELETGMGVVQATLRRTVGEREEARVQLASLQGGAAPGMGADELNGTLDMMSDALAQTAEERDATAATAEEAVKEADDLNLELRLVKEHNDEIFRQVEDALTVSVEPLDSMFRKAGLDPQRLLSDVRKGYSGTGGPLTPLSVSTMGDASADDAALRANRILDTLDRFQTYNIAVARVPFSMPLHDAFRYTSGFQMRWGRMHEGVDMAGAMGTPVYATADGVVIYAGWSNGYGRLIKIQHEFGIETRYGHLSALRVQVGQRVSRGDRIGDMGNSGRSTGTHLHYEIRLDGEPINPMIYIGAGNDVL